VSENGARKSESPAPVQAPPLELNLLPAELVLRSSVLPALDGVYRLKRHGGGGGERRGAGEEEPASASGGGDGPIHAVGYEYVQAGTDAPASPSPKQKQKKQKQKKKKKKRKELAPEADEDEGATGRVRCVHATVHGQHGWWLTRGTGTAPLATAFACCPAAARAGPGSHGR